MSSSNELVGLQNGLIVPARAYDLAIRLEAEGIKLVAVENQIAVPDGATDGQIAAIRGVKHHLLLLLRYRASDRHLRDDPRVPFPEHGPIVREGSHDGGLRLAS